METNETVQGNGNGGAVKPPSDEYRVRLSRFAGPLDLLLYLIKEKELEITDISIAQITDQFLEYAQTLAMLDLEQAGEFLVMASTLMEIKSRALLPRLADEEMEEDEEDPGSDLIRQLMEYRRYKEASNRLGELWESQENRFRRIAGKWEAVRESEEEEGPAVEGVELWDLVKAFTRVLRETQLTFPGVIRYDDVPVAVHMERVLERVAGISDREVTFRELCLEKRERLFVIGTFLALLELIRLRKIRVEQSAVTGELRVRRRESPPPEQENK